MVVLLEGLIINFDIRRVEIDLSAGQEVLGFFLCFNVDSDNFFRLLLFMVPELKFRLSLKFI